MRNRALKVSANRRVGQGEEAPSRVFLFARRKHGRNNSTDTQAEGQADAAIPRSDAARRKLGHPAEEMPARRTRNLRHRIAVGLGDAKSPHRTTDRVGRLLPVHHGRIHHER